ncbi:MAG TPA: DUF4432 family protein [Deinococcales bacterium]|nr:DUF4432 family protein [Deinococcales bacterium]
MPRLFGQQYSKRDLLALVGRMEQVAGVRRAVLAEGPGAGTEVVEVRAGDLQFEVLPTRGLDLGAARWRGLPLAWISPAGPVHPALRPGNPETGFVRSFGGGLLTTGGLENVGRPFDDPPEVHGLHGRQSFIPAEGVGARTWWDGDDFLLGVSGIVREASLYAPKLERTRVVHATLGEDRITLTDVVENVGFEPAPCMLLYHMNFGWPLVGPGTLVEVPSRAVTVIEGSADGWDGCPAPAPGFTSQVLEHDVEPDEDGMARFRLRSSRAVLEVAYDRAAIPRFTQWRMFGAADYVLGLEPGTVGVRGRAAEVAAGTLPMLEPGESRTFKLEISVSAP